MAEHGYIVIADITGYTRFLTGSEFEHAQGILEDLFAVILERMKSPLVLSNIEGDAFLAHAHSNTVPDGTILIDTLEALYWGFRARVQHMLRNTNCECAACRHIADLDLKLIVHHGEYVEHELAGRKELSGPDVILAHRLLKNDIVQMTGIVSYAAYTAAAVDALDLASYFWDAISHSESLEEFGDVEAKIVDLGASWVRYDGANEVVLGDDTERWIDDISHDYPYAPELLWHYMTAPEHRSRYTPGVESLTRKSSKDGRLTAGTVDHCAHGKQILVFTTLDSRPYRHITSDMALPMGATLRFSILFEALESGTRVTARFAKPVAGNAIAQAMVRLVGRMHAKPTAEGYEQSLANLEALIAGDLATGAIRAETAGEVSAELLQHNIRDAIGVAAD